MHLQCDAQNYAVVLLTVCDTEKCPIAPIFAPNQRYNTKYTHNRKERLRKQLMQSHAFKSFVYGCQVRLYRDDLFPNSHHSWHWALGEGKVKKAILSPKMGIPFSVWNHFRQFVLLYICFAVRSVPGSLHHALYKYTPARVELRGRSKCAVKCLFRRRRITLRLIICVPNCVIFTEKSPKS